MSKRICILLACILGGAVSLSGQSGTSPSPPATKLENITFSTPLPHAPAVTRATDDDLQRVIKGLLQANLEIANLNAEIAILKKRVKELESKQKTGKK